MPTPLTKLSKAEQRELQQHFAKMEQANRLLDEANRHTRDNLLKTTEWAITAVNEANATITRNRHLTQEQKAELLARTRLIYGHYQRLNAVAHNQIQAQMEIDEAAALTSGDSGLNDFLIGLTGGLWGSPELDDLIEGMTGWKRRG